MSGSRIVGERVIQINLVVLSRARDTVSKTATFLRCLDSGTLEFVNFVWR